MIRSRKQAKEEGMHNFCTDELVSKWYYNGNTLPHNQNSSTSCVVILVQCNDSDIMIFQSILISVPYHNKFPRCVHNIIDLCTTALFKVKLQNSSGFPFNTYDDIFLPHVDFDLFVSVVRCVDP